MSDDDRDDRLLWSVDWSWRQGRSSANLDGEIPASARTAFHLDRGDTTAKCSPRVLLNSMEGDVPVGTVSEWEDPVAGNPSRICRRCVPRPPQARDIEAEIDALGVCPFEDCAHPREPGAADCGNHEDWMT